MKLHYKTPLPLVIGLVLNIFLVVVLEILLLYRYPAAPEAADFGRADDRYENCTVITEYEGDRIRYFLVKTTSGDYDLIPVQQHAFFNSRGRLRTDKAISDLGAQKGESLQLLFGLRVQRIEILEDRIVVSSSGGGSFQQLALTKYMFLGGVLAFLELYLLEKIKGE